MRLLRVFQERFGFTRTELVIIMLLTISLLIGTTIRHLRTTPAVRAILPSPSVDSQLVRGARAFHDAVRQPPGTAPDTTAVSTGNPLDLNRAGESDLVRLPGIGPALARRILSFRSDHGRFARVEDLRKVRGIGPRTLERIRPLVRVHPQRRPDTVR